MAKTKPIISGSKHKASECSGAQPPAKRARTEKKTAPMSNQRIVFAAAIAAKRRQSRPAAAAAAAGAGAEYVPTAPLPPLAASLHSAMLDRVALQATVAATAKAIAVQALLELNLALDKDDEEEDVPLPESPKRLSPELEQLEKNGRVAFVLETKTGPFNIGYHERIQYEVHVENNFGKPTIRKGWVLACELQSLRERANEHILHTYIFYLEEKFEIPHPILDDLVYVMNPHRDPHKEGMDMLFAIAKSGLTHEGLKLCSDGLTGDQIFTNYLRLTAKQMNVRTAAEVNQLIDQWRASGDLRIAPPSIGSYDRGFSAVDAAAAV